MKNLNIKGTFKMDSSIGKELKHEVDSFLLNLKCVRWVEEYEDDLVELLKTDPTPEELEVRSHSSPHA